MPFYHRRSDALFRIEEYSFHMSIVISIFPPFFLHSNGSSERVLKHNLRLLPSIVNTHFRPHYFCGYQYFSFAFRRDGRNRTQTSIQYTLL